MLTEIHQGSNYFIFPLDLRVILSCRYVTKIREMHDKIICATAKLLNVAIITIDAQRRQSNEVETIW